MNEDRRGGDQSKAGRGRPGAPARFAPAGDDRDGADRRPFPDASGRAEPAVKPEQRKSDRMEPYQNEDGVVSPLPLFFRKRPSFRDQLPDGHPEPDGAGDLSIMAHFRTPPRREPVLRKKRPRRPAGRAPQPGG